MPRCAFFLDVVSANRSQFLFLAREQYGGCLAVRQAIAALREDITRDLAADLTLMPKLQHLDAEGLHVMADLIVKSVFATLPDIIDPPAHAFAGPPHAPGEDHPATALYLYRPQALARAGQHRIKPSTRRVETLGSGVVLVPIAIAQ